jgi:hypothetical protein
VQQQARREGESTGDRTGAKFSGHADWQVFSFLDAMLRNALR